MIRMLIEHYKARRLERFALRELSHLLNHEQMGLVGNDDAANLVRDATRPDVQ